jgi:hypothetical protein
MGLGAGQRNLASKTRRKVPSPRTHAAGRQVAAAAASTAVTCDPCQREKRNIILVSHSEESTTDIYLIVPGVLVIATPPTTAFGWCVAFVQSEHACCSTLRELLSWRNDCGVVVRAIVKFGQLCRLAALQLKQRSVLLSSLRKTLDFLHHAVNHVCRLLQLHNAWPHDCTRSISQ